ncbi:NAD(P)/FAD-dependent oxidoreductase [Arthrobacter sp. Y81]|uniref:flavin monoamine oxidase family protein n=1 Tax=Arthrobacter sp. Y81 TaxID=2058897 RepID=UPI0015E3E771|nr:NAD(P)/FAD-dependent oxidoreductase [Arthrobacter sp. Y81]
MTLTNNPEPAALDADVIVIGAGISGSSAAKALHDQGKKVIIVEANDRIGGRTWTEPGDVPGGPIDYGGMFIGETHTQLIELGTSLGLEMTPSGKPGDDTYVVLGDLLRAPDEQLDTGLAFVPEFLASLEALDKLADSVGWNQPWAAPDAAVLDSKTVGTWLTETVESPEARQLHTLIVNAILGAHPDEVSLLYWAYYVSECEGIESLLGTRDGAQWAWWIGGAAQVSWRIADAIGRDNVLLDWPVSRIEQNSSGVTVFSSERSLSARHVIIAMSPLAANQIGFEPPLPPARTQLQAGARMGRYYKLQVRYTTPFWVEQGYSGAIMDTDDYGTFILDGTKPTDSLATLIGFVGGSSYDRWAAHSAEERQSAFIELLVKAFGPEAKAPSYFHETNWTTQEWAKGGPVTYMPPGVLAHFGAALRDSVGRIHFAGTEASFQWSGYMEGGVRAGQKAAAAILENFA